MVSGDGVGGVGVGGVIGLLLYVCCSMMKQRFQEHNDGKIQLIL